MKQTLLILLPIGLLILSLLLAVRFFKKSGNVRKAFAFQLASFIAIGIISFSASAIVSYAADTSAQETTTSTSETAKSNKDNTNKGLIMVAAALALGIPGIGAGIALAAGAPSAIAATSENPKLHGKYIVFVALGESIALFGFVISMMIILLS